jgi:hypothetical protein
MRVSKFDEQETAALRALRFTIDDDGEVASTTGQIKVEVMRPSHDKSRVELGIVLPDGSRLNCSMPRARLLEAARGGEEF